MNTHEVREEPQSPPAGVPRLEMSEQLAQSMRAVRRRWRIVVILPLVALLVSLVVSAGSATEYVATAKVVISPYNPVTVLLNPGSNPTSADPERDLNTAVSEITETPMANRVRASLRLSESSEDLLREVSANLEGTTNIVDVEVTDGSAAQAARIANAFATQYVDYRLALARATLQRAAARVEQRIAALSPTQLGSAAGRQLQANLGTLQANSDGLTSDAQVSEVAAIPSSPAKPKPLTDAVIALVVGLLIALVIVAVLELLDRTVRDEEDAAAVARLPCLGSIPRRRSRLAELALTRQTTAARPPRRRGAHADDAPEPGSRDWELAESYGSLAVSLLSLGLAPSENVVMVTSPEPQDGKTSVTLGLAAALAELGQRVIVVECDLRRPRIAEYLGLPPVAEGLSTILAGKASPPTGCVEVSAATRQALTGRPRAARAHRRANAAAARGEGRTFTVLPCGPVPAKPLALLRGQELGPVIAQLQSVADIVLIDTPPLGAIKDAVVVAESVGQVVLVARIGHTRRDALARCRNAVAGLSSGVLGIIAVGGARGAVFDYYFRGELRGAVHQPKLVAVDEQRLKAPASARATSATPAASKTTRVRRRARADGSS